MSKKITLFFLVIFLLMSVLVVWLTIKYPSTPTANTTSTSSQTIQSTNSTYTKTEVSSHNKMTDCWLIVQNIVYDVTPYLPKHPAGSRIIEQRCGMEVTGIFASIHSNRAWNLLTDYKVGIIGSQESTAITTSGLDVQAVADLLKETFSSGEILKVQPYDTGFLALVALDNKLYDVLIDDQGTVLSQQARRDEFEWFWNADDNEVSEVDQ